MISSISHFKAWIIALCLFVAIEVGYYAAAKPGFMARTNILDYRIGHGENLQRLFAFDKLEKLSETAPTIVQVGDSSGFHAVIPGVVESMLPGNRYLNMSIATTLGYRGYLILAEQVLKRNPTAKTVVLYNSMLCAFPRPSLWEGDAFLPGGFAGQGLLWRDFDRDLNNPVNKMTSVPTLALREDVSRYVWGLGQPGQPRHSNFAYRMFNETMVDTQGWLRETDNADDLPGDMYERWDPMLRDPKQRSTYDLLCPEFVAEAWHPQSLSRKNYVELILDEYRKMTRKYGARLVVIPNPLPESAKSRRNMIYISGELAKYQAKYPEVSIVWDFEYWPDHRFSAFSHVGTPYAVDASIRVGQALKEIVATQPAATAPPKPLQDRPTVQEIRAVTDFSHYGLQQVEYRPPAPARRVSWKGRREFLLHRMLIAGRPHALQIFYPQDMPNAVRDTATISVFGTPLTTATVCEAPVGESCREYIIPAAETARYNGYVEVLFSSRGLLKWPEKQATDAPDDALFQVSGFRFEAREGAPVVSSK